MSFNTSGDYVDALQVLAPSHCLPEVICVCALLHAGGVTGNMTVSGGNFTVISNGTFTYSYEVQAMERLNFTATLDGSHVGTG